MPSTAEIIRDAESLPVEGRTFVVDSLLRSLNSPDPEIDQKWAAVAKRRLGELRSGKVQPVPGDEVFAKIRQRFGDEEFVEAIAYYEGCELGLGLDFSRAVHICIKNVFGRHCSRTKMADGPPLDPPTPA
jgi:putative addiction module component (TIGR02574 family)